MNFHQLVIDICRRSQSEGLATLPAQERQVLAVMVFLLELNNGGLHQYFANSAGDSFSDLLDGLDALGCTREGELVRESIAVFGPTGYSPDRDARCRLLFPADDDGELDEALMDQQAAILTPLNRQLQERVAEIGHRNEEYALDYYNSRKR